MTPIEQQVKVLADMCPGTTATAVPTGGHLITIPNYALPPGWSANTVTLLFLAPPGYPAAQPDCFWVEPTGIRLQSGATPQATNGKWATSRTSRPRWEDNLPGTACPMS